MGKTSAAAKGDALDFAFRYGFDHGCLEAYVKDGREVPYAFPTFGNGVKALEALWPAAESRRVAGEATDIWKDDKCKRLRLWFDNPNKAGLLFAEIALAALALLWLRPLWAKILGGVLSLAAFGGLVATSSRGAFLAFLCSIVLVLLTQLHKLLTWRRLAMLAAAVAIAVGCLFASGQGERLVKNLFKEGQTKMSRITVWKEVPSMVVDAPGGWGLGKSAHAYIDWYQEKNDCLLKDMISGHLTFLVETGWCLRFCYVFFLGLFLLAASRMAYRGASPIPLGIAVAFAVAACFNPVVAVWDLWVIPAAAMAVVWRDSRRRPRKGSLWAVGFAAICAMVVLGGVAAWGAMAKTSPTVNKTSTATVINGKTAAVYLAEDDYVLHGGYWWMFGKELRGYFRAHPEARAVGHVRRVSDLPAEMEKLVLVGETGRDFLQAAKRPSAKEIVFISPPFTWREVPQELLDSAKVTLVAGQVAARMCGELRGAPEWVRFVRGAELYIPGWTEYLK